MFKSVLCFMCIVCTYIKIWVCHSMDFVYGQVHTMFHVHSMYLYQYMGVPVWTLCMLKSILCSIVIPQRCLHSARYYKLTLHNSSSSLQIIHSGLSHSFIFALNAQAAFAHATLPKSGQNAETSTAAGTTAQCRGFRTHHVA